jgi:extracellular factor (EF) 3-hydroxypalmitic acid methyl ester biosynthesis protein
MPPTALLERSIYKPKNPPSPWMELDGLMLDWLPEGGPRPEDYPKLTSCLDALYQSVKEGTLQRQDVVKYARDLTKRYFQGTLQAKAMERKYGYSGDFEIIDDIYRMRVAQEPHLRRWDLFFQAQAAPRAVRNRKAYFHQLMDEKWSEHAITRGPLQVLNVASGPARDVREWFLEHEKAQVRIECIDADVHAIEHAKVLCAPFLKKMEFHHRNAMRFLPERGYDLVWSAGLFDYLQDRSFVFLLKALLAVTRPGGEVVAGNFSPLNSSRAYMELLGDWVLHHRTEKELRQLALEAGAEPSKIEVRWEPEGVNLFLHVRR